MRNQQGAALLALLLIIITATSFLLLKAIKPSLRTRDMATATALAQAKQALIGWSVARGGSIGTSRPGELPCPDTSEPGSSDYGLESSPCAAGAIGRLPWKTLGVAELKDAYGETLWYALDGAFRLRSSNSDPVNSDTRATMQVYNRDGDTLLTVAGSEAVAIIFSPGLPVGTQVRGTVAEQLAAANYLDNAAPPIIATARDNAVVNGPFIQGGVLDSDGTMVINDRLLVVSAQDLMAVLEKRVAKEVETMLGNYFVTNGWYPYPARHDDPDCLDVGLTGGTTNCNSDSSQCRGRLSDTSLPVPEWFTYNLWGQLIYYTVGTDFLQAAPANCSATVTVNGTSVVSGLLIMPGAPLGTVVRNVPSQSDGLVDYLEDSANQDGWTVGPPDADSYVIPTAVSNDRMYTLP